MQKDWLLQQVEVRYVAIEQLVSRHKKIMPSFGTAGNGKQDILKLND